MKHNSLFNRLRHKIAHIAEDEEKLQKLLFRSTCILLSVVSMGMALVDAIVYRTSFPWALVGFAALCLVNLFLYDERPGRRVAAENVLIAELLFLLGFLTVTGEPDGFSILWICMVPSFSMLLFRRKKGALLCLLAFLILIFFLWTPWGFSFLHFPYSAAFRLRFPILFLVLFAASLMFETLRHATHNALERARDGYEQLYIHDPLTGIYNRYGFRRVRDAFFQNAEKGRAMAMLDLDHFKMVNDQFGHDVGDDILLEFVNVVKETVGSRGTLSRWGGEEFMLMIDASDTAEELCRSLIKNVREHPFVTQAGTASMTVSIGLVVGKPGEVMQYRQVLRLADSALFRAKENGRDQLVCVPYTEDQSSREPQILM